MDESVLFMRGSDIGFLTYNNTLSFITMHILRALSTQSLSPAIVSKKTLHPITVFPSLMTE
jgi:hypothetical protein